MEEIFGQIEQASRQFARHPFFHYLRSSEVAPLQRFAFARQLTPWVLGFADFCRDIVADEQSEDLLQRQLNVHTREDQDHWRWFLQDVAALDAARGAPPMSWSASVEFLWGPTTLAARRLTSTCVGLGYGASPLEKLVVLESVEATNKVALEAVQEAARALARETGIELVYLGEVHERAEQGHTREHEEHGEVRALVLEDARRVHMRSLIERVFAAFDALMTELHAGCLDR